MLVLSLGLKGGCGHYLVVWLLSQCSWLWSPAGSGMWCGLVRAGLWDRLWRLGAWCGCRHWVSSDCLCLTVRSRRSFYLARGGLCLVCWVGSPCCLLGSCGILERTCIRGCCCRAGDRCSSCCCQCPWPGFRCLTGCRWSWSLTTLFGVFGSGALGGCLMGGSTGEMGGVFVWETEDEKMWCVCVWSWTCWFASTTAAPLLLYTSFPSLLASLHPSHPYASGAKTLELGLWPGLQHWRSCGSAACSDSCARALLRPGPVLLLELTLLAQAQGFGHHLPSLPSAKLLALASRWPLLLAPTSRRPIRTRQFASTSPQSSWTIFTVPGRQLSTSMDLSQCT